MIISDGEECPHIPARRLIIVGLPCMTGKTGQFKGDDYGRE